MSIKIINTGRKAPLDAANCTLEIAKNETQGSRVVDYVYNVCGKEFCETLSKMTDEDCGNKLNSIGFKAVPSIMFKDKLGTGTIPNGYNFAKFYDEVKGSRGNSRKDDVVARGWMLLNGQKYPKIWDEELMYVVDGRAMHRDVYNRHKNWDAYIKAGGVV